MVAHFCLLRRRRRGRRSNSWLGAAGASRRLHIAFAEKNPETAVGHVKTRRDIIHHNPLLNSAWIFLGNSARKPSRCLFGSTLCMWKFRRNNSIFVLIDWRSIGCRVFFLFVKKCGVGWFFLWFYYGFQTRGCILWSRDNSVFLYGKLFDTKILKVFLCMHFCFK